MNDEHEYLNIEREGIQWTLRRDRAQWFIGHLLPDPSSLSHLPRYELIRKTGTRTAIRFPLTDPPGCTAYLKHHKSKTLYQLLKYSLLKSPPSAEWAAARTLNRLGVPAAQPLALGERRVLGILHESYAVFEGVPEARSLREVLDDTSDPAVLDRALEAVASSVSRMHRHHLFHPDLHIGNILLTGLDGPRPLAYIIDLHSLQRRNARLHHYRRRDLAVLWTSLSKYADKKAWRRFLEQYAEDAPQFRRGHDEHAAWIDRLTAGFRRKYYNSRARRCLRTSGGFIVERRSGRTVYRRRSVPPGLIAAAIRRHIRTCESGGPDLVKAGPGSAVTRVPPDGRWRGLYVKEFIYAGLWNRLRKTLAMSGGLRAWHNGNALKARGVPTCDFLGLVEESRGLLKTRSFLVMSELEGVTAIDGFIYSNILEAPFNVRKRFARCAAEYVALLHRKGVFHGDLKASNILVREAGAGREHPGGWEMFVVDPGSVSFPRRITLEQRALNLAQLNSSLRMSVTKADRMRFFRRYLAASDYKGDPRALLRAVLQFTASRDVVWNRPGIREAPPPRLRILHVYADWKWTGAAEPTVNLACALQRFGHDVWIACQKGPPDYPMKQLSTRARSRGLKVVTDFSLSRCIIPWDLVPDVFRMIRFLRRHEIDIIHAHQSYEHFVCGLAGRIAARLCDRPVVVVRTSHSGVPQPNNFINRFLLRRLTDGLVVISQRALQADARLGRFRAGAVTKIEGTVNLEKFDPDSPVQDKRPELGIAPDDVVAGIVARMQRHRRFDVLLRAVALAVKKVPNLKLVIVGRGTHMHEVAIEPARRMGLENHVVFAGYRTDDYRDVLACFDMKVFLVPGSDGSCRAVREAMSMGKPVIASNRGMLPEIVNDGETGLIVEDTPEKLADAIVRLALDPGLTTRLGRAARRKALETFGIPSQAEALQHFYLNLLHACRRAGHSAQGA